MSYEKMLTKIKWLENFIDKNDIPYYKEVKMCKKYAKYVIVSLKQIVFQEFIVIDVVVTQQGKIMKQENIKKQY